MSYDTVIRATSEIDWRLLFLQARKVVGIPDEWPFETDLRRRRCIATSEPNGFDAHVCVYSHEFEASPEDDEDDGPLPCFVDLHLQTCGHPEADQLHDGYVSVLGAWLDTLGVSYATCDSRGHWHSEMAA